MSWKLLAMDVPQFLKDVEKEPTKTVKDFVTMFKSVAPPQSVLSILSTVACGYLTYKTGNRRFLAATLLAVFPMPWTMLVMMPQANNKMFALNKRIEESSEEMDAAQVEPIVKTWRWMHSLRAITATAAFAIIAATAVF
eukprot:gene7351-8564_t